MSDPFIGEVRVFANKYVPDGWFPCDGRTLNVRDYQALYAIIGNTYGGTYAQTFVIPNLNGMAAVGPGQSQGGSTNYVWGHTYGQPSVTITPVTMATHTHQLQKKTTNAPIATAKTAAPSASSDLGGVSDTAGVAYKSGTTATSSANTHLASSTLAPSGAASPAPHENRQPFLAMYYAIAYLGEWPVNPN